jgi:hypothetical protein
LRLREQGGQIYDLDVVGRPDTFTVLAALATVTDRLGLAGTINSTFNEPYEVARQFASLDHVGQRPVRVVGAGIAVPHLLQEPDRGRAAHLLTPHHGRLLLGVRARKVLDVLELEASRLGYSRLYLTTGVSPRRAGCTWRRVSRRCSTSPFRRPGRFRSRRPCSF